MFACPITGSVGNAGELETNFIYDEARPFEVRLQNVHGDDIVFSRDLMSEAYSRPGTAGIGYVRMQVHGQSFFLSLVIEGSIVTINYPAAAVEDFHNRTYDLVPWGSESIDFDSLLEDFNEDKI
jgi:hypothetical protein